MGKIITWKAVEPYFFEVAPRPVPASQVIPNWWREEPPYEPSEANPNGKKLIVENYRSNATFKKCTPMMDAITSGYIIPLWADVQIRKIDDEETRITWRVQRDVFQKHGPSSDRVPTPNGFNGGVFKYIMPWIPITPPGYSVLITSPFGYQQVPFRSIPAVVDTDKSTLHIVPPMWLDKNFEGILEKGTPMIQVIPFKREKWKQEFDSYAEGEYQKVEGKNFNATIVSHYIKNHWSKKEYK